MSKETLRSFLDAVKGDCALQKRVKSACEPDEVVAIANQAGFKISADEFRKATFEISDDELQSISGGLDLPALWGYQGWLQFGGNGGFG